MSTYPPGPRGNVEQLPPYHALLVVDMKDFSGNPGRDHPQLTKDIPEILRQTFARCGLGELWDEVRFRGSTGDGYFLGFDSLFLPFLLNPFLSALQNELDYRNRVCAVPGHDRSVRMRVSVNVGPMTYSGANCISDGSGESRIETHRLLDSAPVRDLLARSGAATSVAAIVSSRAFEDAVLSGFADDAPELYVRAPVEVKSYRGQAYLRVPRPSGDLLIHGFPQSKSYKHVPQTRNTDQGRASVSTIITNAEGTMNTGSGPQFNSAPPFTGWSRRRKDDQR